MTKKDAQIAIQTIVGRNIHDLRVKEKCSQQKLADMIGMNRTYLSDVETGKGNASLDILAKIADGLDVPITDLFAGLESDSPSSIKPE